MAIDPNRVKEIFLGATEQPDEAARAAFLDRTCGPDAGLRERVEALLRSHDPAGSFLGTPAAIASDSKHGETLALDPIPGPGSTRDGDGKPRSEDDDEADDLSFLSPTTRADSLGRIGHYEILQVLGKGGFGIVFRAFDDVLQRVVALKIMAPRLAATSPARKRFIREARSSAQVRHENVVQVYEVKEQPLPYLVMEFIPGETLQQRLDRTGPLDVPEVLRIGRQVAEGLAAAHASDLIHRDIKPGNILIEGGSQRVKITDFGLARAADDASMSQSGVIAGTPMYMAPEQALGHQIDQRADLFSLGSVLYQMVSGRPPFRAPSALAVLKRVAEETPRPISEIIPETPAWVCDIITKLHAKNPYDRFQTAREVADLLADCEAKLKAKQEVKNFLPASPSTVKPAAPTASSRRKWVAAAAVLLLPVIALAVTEFVGVTHLFRQQVTPVTGPVLVGKNELPPLADGWVRLFNGKDLSGWKTHDLAHGNWRVEDGAIVGRGNKSFLSFLFSESEYADFHLRVEAKINAIGDSGVIFRVPFDVRLWDEGTKIRLAGGYEAQIAVRSNYRIHTGSLLWDSEPPVMQGPPFIQQGPLMPHRPDEWFVLEVIAQGNRIQTFVNGKKTADCVDEQRRYDRGHLALQTWGSNITFVQFRKIEIKELPASSLPPTFKNTLGMEFVIVPKGKVRMGGTGGKLGDKGVEVEQDVYLGKYEVTQEEWEQVTGGNPSNFKDLAGVAQADQKRFPVEMVSWADCQTFVKLVNEKVKEPGWVYRLPTEAEWEYACRGGPSANKLDYSFDFYLEKPSLELKEDQANFNQNLNRTCKVGGYQPNKLGLYDMHGNVWEWCQDEWRDTHRVGRGGGWRHPAKHCRAALGDAAVPDFRVNDLGLRLARVPSGSPSPEGNPPKDANRLAAEYVLSTDGWIGVNNQAEEMRKLPSEPFRLTGAGIGRYKVSDAGLARLKDCANLTVLNLNDAPQLTDAGLVHLMDCKNLTYLGLAVTQVTDDGLAYFKDCRNLTHLLLHGTRVTDAGLAHIKNWRKLTNLTLENTKITTGGIDELKKALPYCKIRWNGGVIEPKSSPQPVVPFTDADAKRIAALPAGDQVEEVRKELQRLNPGFKEKKLEHKIEGEAVTELHVLTDEVLDIAPVRALPGLIYLDCRGTYPNKGKLSDLSPLKGTTITRLDCSSTQVANLAPLSGMPLTFLHFNHNPVSDLTPLQGMPLVELGCAETKVTDFSPLKGMKLQSLGAQLLGVTDLTPLQGMPLKGLDLYHTLGATNLQPLKGMPLEGLNLQDVPVADLAPLKGMTTLRSLTLMGSKVSDLTPLQGLKLTDLFLQDKQITDLSPLKGMPLVRLGIDGSGVTDLRPLLGMELQEIRLTPKNITQGLEVLRGMKTLKTIAIGSAENQVWPAAEFWERHRKGEFKE